TSDGLRLHDRSACERPLLEDFRRAPSIVGTPRLVSGSRIEQVRMAVDLALGLSPAAFVQRGQQATQDIAVIFHDMTLLCARRTAPWARLVKNFAARMSGELA